MVLAASQAFVKTFGLIVTFGGIGVVVNVIIALRLRSGPSLRAVGIRRSSIRGAAAGTALGGAALVALVLSGGAGTQWQNLAMFQHARQAPRGGRVGDDRSGYNHRERLEWAPATQPLQSTAQARECQGHRTESRCRRGRSPVRV